MITSDQEQQVKLQFLDEATDYLDTIESGLLGLGTGKVTDKQVDALLRAAHSIKGGAAMMGYTVLAGLGHQLEDYFKIIQYGKAAKPDDTVERLMLSTIDKFRQIVTLNRQGQDPDEQWLESQVMPIFAQLREILGEFDPDDQANMLASESGEDILGFLFESEVERTLTQLEESIASNVDASTLYDEVVMSAEDLAGFSEMVELPALGELCRSVLDHLTAQPHQIVAITELAIAAWRRTQALVLIGQTGNLPTEIELPGSGIPSNRDTTGIPNWHQSPTADSSLPSFGFSEADTISIAQVNAICEADTVADTKIRAMAEAETAIDMTVDEIVSFSEAETIDETHVRAITEAETLSEERVRSMTEAETLSSEWGQFDLYDLASAQAVTIDDLGGIDGSSESAMPPDRDIDAKTLQTIDNPDFSFGTTSGTRSTVTDSNELEPLTTNDLARISERYPEDATATIANSITVTVEEAADPEIDAFEMLDLSGDLSINEGEASGLLSELSGFFEDLTPNSPDPEPSSAVFRIERDLKPKENALDREAAELLKALDAAPEVIDDLPHEKADATAAATAAPAVEQTIRVSTKQLDDIGDLFGELTIDRNGLNIHIQALRQLVFGLQNKVKQLEQSNFKLREAYDSASSTGHAELTPVEVVTAETSAVGNYANDLDLLEFDRYDERHILSQEVIDNIVQIEELTTDLDLQLNEAERTNRGLNRTAVQLQTGLTQVRMRPISELFNRFPRAMRNLSIEHGKPLDLQLKGGSTLVERSILESLNDPLMHLIRNAFDHGLEPPAVRRANGKSETGKIELSATYRGNQTVITIKDDGGGIDLDKIRAKVLKMGISEKEVANFSDNELIELIFEPGFSTANKVTDLSGRGVGMDVVRTNIRALRGDIFVDTKLGKGTTFTVTVPFTLSVVRVLLVEINGLWLAIPSNIVEEIILLDRERIFDTAGQQMLQWEGFTVRLIQPGRYLNLANPNTQLAANATPTIDRSTVLMVDQGQDVVAVEIDKFWGEQEVTIRQPQGTIKMPPGFTGCTILGDGRIVPLVDAIELLRWIDGDVGSGDRPIGSKFNFQSELPEDPAPVVETVKRSRILVVDDSINVRRFVALTLEKAGYLVEQAKDGQEAVEKLQAGLEVQAVVCDVEMPRMDGYGFLATVKGDKRFKQIPVMMLTSRSGDKHRKIAMNLGASAYFSKPFKEQELLAMLTQLVGKS